MRTEWVGRAGLAIAASIILGNPVSAQRVVSGTSNGLSWTASNTIVGVNSTATIVGGGDARYLPPMPAANGIVTIISTYADGGAFICTGSLLSDRQSVLTAAHCNFNNQGQRPVSQTVYFPTNDPDNIPASQANAGVRTVSRAIIHPQYTGEVIDQNDIAILRLNSPAPTTARSYGLFTPPDLTGSQFNVFGYGGRSDQGGNVGANLGTGRLRQGLNRFDFRFGDSQFGGFWTNRNPSTGNNFFGKAEVAFSFVSDFDNGLAANDTACRLAGALGLGGAKFCNLGLGADEVSIAGGDSGGPTLINGEIAAINSYGLTFGPNFGDIRQGLNSSFGEFNGFVPVYIHAAFINGFLVPEPATIGLTAFGVGVLGLLARRRRRLN